MASSRVKRNTSPSQSNLDLTKPQTFVTITVGQGKFVQDFVMHKSFLTHYSPFFRSAFNRPFFDRSNQSMKVENVSREVFGLVHHWIYLQQLPSLPLEAPSLENLAKVWLAAEHFKIPALQNHASYALCDRLSRSEGSIKMRGGVPVLNNRFDDYLACIKHIYFSTPAGEHVLKLLVLDIFPYKQIAYADRIEDFPIAFCQDVTRLLAKRAPASESWPVDRKPRFTVQEDLS
ncbi:hypothetical protein BKA64DRAFT_641698 [Cadophora sp. MPI-SDFR-AT-0126]|nr:hypothetical protein BKA64DRAFT_641698 [Leotiomycetes sp. MPI-SDFR-AT-0126]